MVRNQLSFDPRCDPLMSATACNPMPLAEMQRVIPGTQNSIGNINQIMLDGEQCQLISFISKTGRSGKRFQLKQANTNDEVDKEKPPL